MLIKLSSFFWLRTILESATIRTIRSLGFGPLTFDLHRLDLLRYIFDSAFNRFLILLLEPSKQHVVFESFNGLKLLKCVIFN